MSSSGCGTVINYGSSSGSDFLTNYGSYGSGSGSTTLPGGEGGEQLLVELVLQPLLGRLHRLQGGAQLVQGTVLRLMVPEHDETANQQSRKENP